MLNVLKPSYLNTITDPSFGTQIRRITNANSGERIVPLYSTIQAWNADESLMIVYDVDNNKHLLLNGMDYNFIRNLSDINPDDEEQIFWSHTNPNILFYIDDITDDLIEYNVSSQQQNIIVNLASLVSNPNYVSCGDDVQMQSWNDDIFTFRTSNTDLYSYQISTNTIQTINTVTPSTNYAPNVSSSGNFYFHEGDIYDVSGNYYGELNLDNNIEHSCLGKLTNGNEAYFSIAFEEGEFGGCQGTIIAHDLTDTSCFPIIPYGSGYPYPQSGTHISALAHNNSEGGWIAASMVGFNQDGQSILDQEIIIAKAENGNVKICRVAHHRSDEDEFNYYGEPHVTISPSGSRLLFASDWSGIEDGESVDCYVVELPVFYQTTDITETNNPKKLLQIIDVLGRQIISKANTLLFYIYDDGTVEKKIVVE